MLGGVAGRYPWISMIKSAAKGDIFFSSKKLTFKYKSPWESHFIPTAAKKRFLELRSLVTVSGIPDFPADTLRTMQIKILMARLGGDRLIPEIAPLG